jgi:hypothetical protein
VVSAEEFVEFAELMFPRLRRTAFLLCGDWHTGPSPLGMGSDGERGILRVGEAAEASLFHDVVVFHLQYYQAAVDLYSGLRFERDHHAFLEDLVPPHPVSPVHGR